MTETTTKPAKRTIRGISCDNPSCGYRNDSVELDEYENYINEPCPTCGENLLTEKDHAQIQALLTILDMQSEKPNTGIIGVVL